MIEPRPASGRVSGGNGVRAGSGTGNGHASERAAGGAARQLDLDASIGLRRILEALPVIAWLADERGAFLAANARWPEFRGNRPEAGFRAEASLAIHPDEQAALAIRWRRSLRTGVPLEVAVRLLRHDGVYRWHLVRAEPFTADDGRRLWIGTSTDIDDERRERQRRGLVAEAAARLDASLETEEITSAIAELLVPSLGDSCRVELRVPDGEARAWEKDSGNGGFGGDEPADGFVTGDVERAEKERAADRGDGAGGDVEGHAGRRARDASRSDVLSPPRSTRGRGRHLSLPLVARGSDLGDIHLGRRPDREPFTEQDRTIAAEVARHAALALLNARLFAAERDARRRAEQAAERTRRLFRLTRAMARAGSLEEVGRLALQHGRAVVRAPRAYLFLRSEDGLALECLAMSGYPPGTEEAWRRVALRHDRPMTQAARHGLEQWVDDLPAFLRQVPDPGAPVSPGSAATAALPLIAEGRILGVLGFSWTSRHRQTEDERVLARTVAGLAAQAIHRLGLVQAREELVDDLETQHARLVTVVRQLPGGVLIADAQGRIVLANEAADRILGGAPVPGSPVEQLQVDALREDGTPYARDDWPLQRAIRNGEAVENELLDLVAADGERRTLLVSAAPIRGRAGEVETGVVTFSDVTERRAAEANEQYLAEATVLLASSLEPDLALARLASLAVPRVADWCSVEVVDERGGFRQVAVEHPDPRKAELARDLRRRFPLDPDGPVGAPAVVRSGVSELVTEIPPALLDALDMSEETRIVMEGLGLRSYMCVPLRARGTVFGAITFVGAESGRRFGPADLAFAERLADRAATAMDNARLFREADRFRRMVDASADVVLLFDPVTLTVAYANQGASTALGMEAREIAGMSAVRLFDDLDADRLRSLVDPIVSGRTDRRILLLTLHGAGGPTPVELLVQGVHLPGEPPAVLAIARDVSERIESQARLRRLAEAEHARAAELHAVIRAMGEGVLVCAPDGLVTLANPAATALVAGVHLESYADLLGLLEDPGGAPPLRVRGGPVELRVRGAEERWLEVTTYPVGLLPRTGERETIVVLRDVTEARLRQAVRDTFVGVLSHELRTPVTTIYGGAKVLARGGALREEERQAIFTDIHIEAERLHRLVEDVIALTRFGEAEGDIGSEPVLLQRILPGIVRAEESRWPGVTFDVTMPPGLPTVVADPTYVEQVLRNLLSNAAKYGGEGVHVETVVAADADEVTVRILDNGPGFASEEADRLFDLYFRSPRTAARVSGAGIGLFVCARLIRAMGGRIWATPREGGGAEFGFALRRMNEDAD